MEETTRNMDISSILKKLTNNLKKIYSNVNQIVNEQDNNTKTNEEDIICLVEAIEELKIVIIKKKEQLNCPLLEMFPDNPKEVAEKLNNGSNYPSSSSYKVNHNLPSSENYGGMVPFQVQDKSSIKVEESKVEPMMDQAMGIKEEESKPFLSNYGQNLGQDNMFNNEDSFLQNKDDFNLFNDDKDKDMEDEEEDIKVSDLSVEKKKLLFLKKLMRYKKSEAKASNGNNLLSLLSQGKVVVKKGKLAKEAEAQDQEMQEEIKDNSARVGTPNGSKKEFADPFGDGFGFGEGAEGNDLNLNLGKEDQLEQPGEAFPANMDVNMPEQQHVYDDIFDNFGGVEDIGNFGEMDDPFNNQEKNDEQYPGFEDYGNNKDVFGMNEYEKDGDYDMDKKKPNKYLNKMKEDFKNTLKALIKEKEAERAKQDEIIKNHIQHQANLNPVPPPGVAP